MEREKILVVDDEPKVLTAFKRHLGDQFYILTAGDAEEGLGIVNEHEDLAVVIADYRMPGKDGVEFLSEIRQLSPDTIRIIVTGYAGLDNAMEAVNQGHVFKFLTKPLIIDELTKAIKEGIVEYRLNRFKRDLLNKTSGADYHKIQGLLSQKWRPLHYEILKFLKKKEASYASPVDSHSMGQELNITPSYIRGNIRPLLDAGVVDVRMGRKGGYYLKVDPSLLLDWEDLMEFE